MPNVRDDQRISTAKKEILFRKYDLIRNSVSAIDVGRVFGLDISKGRCRCPFHNGTDRNMVLYKDNNRGFYCFVCHEFGDSIKLAQKLLGDGYRYHDAAMWVDQKFQLNIFQSEKPSFRERVRMAELRRKRLGGAKSE